MTRLPEIRIIGIDCATEDQNIGLALGTFNGHSTTLHAIRTGSRQIAAKEIILEWLIPTMPTLLALDSPLGWPISLGQALINHSAGSIIDIPANQLFRRETDRVIRQLLQKQSLEVGADRIARTAHAALKLLGELRQATDQAIPMAWNPEMQHRIAAIEVYPAATLRAYQFQKPNMGTIEAALLTFIDSQIQRNTTIVAENRHAIDAALCVLAGTDFLRGNTLAPTNLDIATREGWIWVKQPS